MGISQDNLFLELEKLTNKDGKHSNYQMLPPILRSRAGDSANTFGNIQIDDQRFDWFCTHWDERDFDVLDIGANFGYFSVRMAQQFNARVTAYEPYEPHTRAIGLVRDLCGLNPGQLTIKNAPVGLDDIAQLPSTHLTLLLNVIHHAGEDFDRQYVPVISDWRQYAVRYLTLVRAKTDFLFFQTGYTWLGHENRFCPYAQILDFTADLLTEAGWKIRHCGVIAQMDEPLQYIDLGLSKEKPNPMPLPQVDKTLLARIRRGLLRLRYGENQVALQMRQQVFAQRPLWICEA